MAPSPVTVYWRPACPYCSRLRSRLRRAGVPLAEVNIWEDRDGAAFVRSVAGGNETVPTVRVGDRTFVNPPPRSLIEAVREFDPSLVGSVEAGRHGRDWLLVFQWVVIGVLIVLSFSAEGLGHSGLSWALDGVALACYLVFRSVRLRAGRTSPVGVGRR